MTVVVRDAIEADLPGVIRVERASFSDPWTIGMFAAQLPPQPGAQFLVAENAGAIVGFAMSRTVLEESELLNLAVDPTARHVGIGAALLDTIIQRCRNAGAATMWLEVRASNAGARDLYESRGFVAAGLRKRYYESPREDAIVLRADLSLRARNKTPTAPVRGLATDREERILSTASHLPRQEIK